MSSNRRTIYLAVFFGLIYGGIGYTFYSIYTQSVENEKHIKLERSDTKTFQLVKVSPPKHFYVDIKDVETQKIDTSVYVSKHCNSWRETAVVGNTYRVVVESYRDDRNGARIIRYRNLYEVFCKST